MWKHSVYRVVCVFVCVYTLCFKVCICVCTHAATVWLIEHVLILSWCQSSQALKWNILEG